MSLKNTMKNRNYYIYIANFVYNLHLLPPALTIYATDTAAYHVLFSRDHFTQETIVVLVVGVCMCVCVFYKRAHTHARRTSKPHADMPTHVRRG